MSQKLFRGVLITGLGCSIPITTLAETATAGSGDRVMEEVVVTATKREQSVQDVALSMAVLDGADLAENTISDVKDLVSLVPNMTYQISPTTPSVALRGFGTAPSNPAYEQTVAVYQDGIHAGRGRQFQAPFFDLARVEVLRGPQGALLGKNTSAGAVNFISASPSEEFEAGLTATYLSDREGIDAHGYVSGALSPTLNARLAMHVLETDEGFLDNLATGDGDPTRSVFSARLTLAWQPTDKFESILRFQHSDLEDSGTVAANFDGTVSLEDIISFDRDFNGGFGMDDGVEVKPWQISNVASYELGELTLVSVTGYQSFDAFNLSGAGTVNPENFIVTQDEDWSQFSQEFRLVSPVGETFDWVAGIYADTSDYELDYGIRYDLFGGLFNGEGHALFEQDARTLSVYGTGTYHATDRFRVVGGLRFTRIKKEGDFNVVQTFGTPFGYTPGNTQSDSLSESHTDPSLTFEYDFGDDSMVYASWSRGSKGGAFQGNNRTVTADRFKLDPEEAEGFEIGLKSQPTDWMTFNAAVFQLTFEDSQTGQFVGTPPALVAVNAGKSRSKGAEWVIGLRPIAGLKIDFMGAYLDAKSLDYPGAPCTFEQLAAGCVNGTINAKGRPFSGQSRWSGTLAVDYTGRLSSELNYFVSTDITYRSKHNIDANTQHPLYGYQDGFTKVDARIGVEPVDGAWSIALIGRNLTDEITVNSAFGWGPPFLATQTVVTRLDPSRSVGIQFSLRR